MLYLSFFLFFSIVETRFTVVWKTTVTIKFLYVVFPVWELCEPCWEGKAWDLALKWNKRGSGMSEIHPWFSSPSGGSGRHGVQASLHTACLALLSLSWASKLLFSFIKRMGFIKIIINWMFQLSFASGSHQFRIYNIWQNYLKNGSTLSKMDRDDTIKNLLTAMMMSVWNQGLHYNS